MRRLEVLRGDWAILRQMLRGLPRNGAHVDNIQAFYAGQAEGYDRFRERLLKGRAELIERLVLHSGAHVVELGGGTGRNLDYFGNRLDSIAAFDLVDLCPALLAHARTRVAARSNVRVIEADATTFRPSTPVDCVYFSYALTMIPDWRGVIENALDMLKPGGLLGVVDFYHSQAKPAVGLVRHSRLERLFWRRWFAHDGVRLDPRHLATLCELLPTHQLTEHRAPVPYLPLMRVPYYLFVGRKC